MAIDPVPAPVSDQYLLLRTMSDLAPSPAATDVLNRALAAGVTIHVRDDAWMDAEVGASTLGAYHLDTNSISMRRSVLEDPRKAVQTLAHELRHAVDDTSGRWEELTAKLDAQYRSEGWTDDERPAQLEHHERILAEARADTFEVQVRRELGIRPWSSYARALDAAPTELAAYEIAWEDNSRMYQPHAGVRLVDPPPVFLPGNTPEDPV